MKSRTNINKFGFTLAEMMIVMSIMTVIIAATLPIITKRANRSHTLLSGSIVMWGGAQPPAGFVVCDGTHNTPDLREYFVIGSDGSAPTSTYRVKSENDKNTVPPTIKFDNLPAHTHAAGTCSASGAHVHSFNLDSPTASYLSHTHTFTANALDKSISSHNHSISGSTGVYNAGASGTYYTIAGYNSYLNCSAAPVSGPSTAHTHGGQFDIAKHTHSITGISNPGDHTHPLSSLNSNNTGASGDVPLTGFPVPPYYALYYIMKL